MWPFDLIPKRQMSEEEVLQMFGIPDFRHMSKSNIMEFVSKIDRVDPAVAKEIIGQFPHMAAMSKDLVHEMVEETKTSLSVNQKSSEATMSLIESISKMLSAQLDKDEISEEERERIYDRLMDLAKMFNAVHKDDQAFALRNKMLDVVVAVAVIGGCITLVGGSGRFNVPEFHPTKPGEL